MDNSSDGTLTRKLNYCYCERLTQAWLTPDWAGLSLRMFPTNIKVFSSSENRIRQHHAWKDRLKINLLQSELLVSALHHDEFL